MIDDLFSFPIIMIDGDKEDRRNNESMMLGIDKDNEVDVIIGEAECPYYDFVSITDRWLPKEESFLKALDGNFDACGVYFMHSGTFIVPWKKEKFKKELKKFADSRPKPITIQVDNE